MKVIVLLISIIVVCQAHVCMVNPLQRKTITNINTQAATECFVVNQANTGPVCGPDGPDPPMQPTVILMLDLLLLLFTKKILIIGVLPFLVTSQFLSLMR